MTDIFNSRLNVQLPVVPDADTDAEFKKLIVIYNAIKQLQYGVDQFLDIPPTPKTAAYTIAITDRGNSIDTTANVVVPTEAASGFIYGATIVVTNIGGSAISIIASSGVDLIMAATAQISNKTLVPFGIATLRYLGNDNWIVAGVGVS